MLKEAIDRILSLAKPEQVQFGGRLYTDKPLSACEDPMPSEVSVKTLTGLVDLIQAEIEGFPADKCVIHVEAFNKVTLINKQSNLWGKRQVYLKAILEDVRTFPFGSFMNAEEFAIWLQAGFVPEQGDVNEIISISANLTAEAVVISEDDGISQRVTVKKGVALKTQVTVKKRIQLAPYRTFREVEQPLSEFIFRVRQDEDGGVPTCALFEADGGKWKLDAMQTIKTYLAAKNLSIPVVS